MAVAMLARLDGEIAPGRRGSCHLARTECGPEALPERAVMAHCVRKETKRENRAQERCASGEERMILITTNSAALPRRGFAAGAGAAGLLTATGTSFNSARAQGGPFKVGVLLPRSGAQA